MSRTIGKAAIVALVPAFLISGCMLDVQEERTGQVSLAATIADSQITRTESAAWPKTVTWCVVGGHQGHANFSWERSWAGGTTSTQSNNCISRQVSTETCDLWVAVAPDGQGHTSDNAYYSVFDVRPVTLSTNPSPATVAVGASVSITASGANAGSHCDGTGSFFWQVRSSNGSWYKFPGSDGVNPLVVSSPTAGDERYRLRSTHQGSTYNSAAVLVTWTNQASGCTIGGTNYSDGTVNPLNQCQICDVSSSTTSWSNRDGHNYSTGGRCFGMAGSSLGTCFGGDCNGQLCLMSLGCQAYCYQGAPVCDPT